MTYIILGVLIAAVVTIIPKVIPLYFLKGKNFNKKVMTFFKIVPYTSMSILILKYVFEADRFMFFPTVIAILCSVLTSYILENMIVTVIVSILSTLIVLGISI